jgi:hypothetical protein
MLPINSETAADKTEKRKSAKLFNTMNTMFNTMFGKCCLKCYGRDETKLRSRSDHLPSAFFCGLTDRIEPIVVSEHTHNKCERIDKSNLCTTLTKNREQTPSSNNDD